MTGLKHPQIHNNRTLACGCSMAGNGGCEAELALRLALLLDSGELPNLEQLQAQLAPRPAQCPTVAVVLPSLASYDYLLPEAA
jgi:hypothetical protein